MRSIRLAVPFAAALALGAGWSAAARADCQLGKWAEMPVTMTRLSPMVSAKVNGVDLDFIADTGAFFSTMTSEAAARARLSSSSMPDGLMVQGASGLAHMSVDEARTFTVLGVTVPHAQFVVGARLGGSADGLIGENLLGATDAEFDLADGVIRLFTTKGCDHANLAYWSDSGSTPSMTTLLDNEGVDNSIRGDAAVNGAHIRVVLDTGSPRSVMTLSAAHRAGLSEKSPGAISGGAIGGVDGREVATWIVPVDKLEIGGEQILHTRVRIGDVKLGDGDMLLGADFFLSHRTFVAKREHLIFFTYNGGPVFDLQPAGPFVAKDGPTPVAAPPAAATPPSPAGAQPSTAADFARQAGDADGRGDHDTAAADYARAAELDPTNAEYPYQRGLGLMDAKDFTGAADAFTAALKLRPDLEHALLARGTARLKLGDFAGADADFDAALKLRPASALPAAQALDASDRFADAIARLDPWLATHPGGYDMVLALSERCWARTLWNHDLDAADRDFAAAIKLAPGATYLLGCRALLRLRQGRYAQAADDLSTLLRASPNAAFPLLELGLAERGLGQTAKGDADIAAAEQKDPKLAARFKDLGFLP